jgi:hypothetical protein
MFMNIQKVNKAFIAVVALAAISLVTGNTISPSSFAQTNQTNNTQSNGTEYVKFHSNIEQIIGHIEKAVYNKNINNNTLAYQHTSHPIEEVVSLITIPLNNTDSKLNGTYFNELYALSNLASPAGHNNSTKEEFNKQAQSSVDLSNKVIATVVPAKTLNTTDHNIAVIQDLLATSGEEYEEGVKDGKITTILEYQDGSAFIDRAHKIFNDTKSIAKERETISALFNNLTTSVQQQKNSSEIEQIIDEINHELSESSSTAANSTATKAAAAAAASNEKSPLDYISNIRSLLDQAVASYSANDATKAEELATTAYLDNFEHIEQPIGKELSDQGESLLREKLRAQIGSNASVEEIKQTISETNTVLDKAESLLKS